MGRLLNPSRFAAEKLAWQHQVLADGVLKSGPKALASLLMHYLDAGKGGAWPSHDFLAERLNVSSKTVKRAIKALVERGHLAVTVSVGRGNANFYRALLADVAGGQNTTEDGTASLSSGPDRAEGVGKNRTPTSSIAEENRTSVTQKGDTHVPPILVESNSPLPPSQRSTGSRRGVGPNRSGRDSDTLRLVGGRDVQWPQFSCPEVRALVVRCLGEDATRSYLDPAVWEAGPKVVLCQHGFAARHLAENAGSQLAALGVTVANARQRAA